MADQRLLDRAISYFAPARGAARLSARRRIDVQLAYEAAKKGRIGASFTGKSTSANSEVASGMVAVRDRAREAVRNSPYAKSAKRALRANSVGPGIIPHSPDDAINDLWRAWAPVAGSEGDGQSIYAIQSICAGAIPESGEVLLRRRPRLPDDGLPVPLQIEVLESDHLDSTRTETLKNGGWVTQGVEYGPFGRRQGFWIYPMHPGESGIPGATLRQKSIRVDAADMIHSFVRDRPGQVRGMSWMDSSLMTLQGLGDYNRAEDMRKKIEACNVGVITRDGALEEDPTRIGEPGEESSDQPRLDYFEPGMWHYLEPGESVDFNDPKGNTAYEAYVKSRLHEAAVGIGVTYHQFTGDLANANYSSTRAGLLNFWALMDEYRRLTLIPQLCNGIWKWFIDAAYLAGEIAEPNYAVKWTAPRYRMVDPAKDVAATERAVRDGLMTGFDAIAEWGNDPGEHLDDLEKFNEELDARGLVLDIDPRRVNRSGAGMGQTVTDDDDEGSQAA